MDGGFPYGDIIVIGAIAAFIILRYRALLGEKTGRDADIVKPVRPLDEYERIIQLPEREIAQAVKKDLALSIKDYGALGDTFSAMHAIDREFSPEEFIEGARAAYEMVIEAYNKNDGETLRMLLSSAICKNFQETLSENEKAGRSHQTTLVAIVKSDIIDAKLRGNVASITVDFQSEQVTLVRGTDGKILEGDPSHQAAVEDRWTFERNLASSDPNWKIIET